MPFASPLPFSPSPLLPHSCLFFRGVIPGCTNPYPPLDLTLALKARFRGQPTGLAPASGLKTKNVDPFGGRPRSSGTAGGRFLALNNGLVTQILHLGLWLSLSTDLGNAGDSEEKLNKLEDFLDDLLG